MTKRRIAVLVSVTIVTLTLIGAPQVYRQWRHYQEKQLAEQCREAARERQWDELKDLATRWTRLAPLNGEAWMLLGAAAKGRREWADAVDDFLRVPDGDPHVSASLAEVTKLSFGALNDPLKGSEAIKRFLRINPNEAEAQKQLIGYYAVTFQRQELARQIRSAIQFQCEPAEAYPYFFLLLSLRDNDALEINERWLKRYPDEEVFVVARFLLSAESMVQDAGLSSMSNASAPEYPRSEDMGLKLEQVNAMLQRFPQNIELLAYKANLCILAGDANGAIEVLSQAPEPAREDARFWRLEGWIHESNQELDKAVSAYRRALELHATDWNTMFRLSVVERHRQNLSEVKRLTELVNRALVLRSEFREAPGSAGPDPSVLTELAKFFRDCGEQTIGPALERRIASMSSAQ